MNWEGVRKEAVVALISGAIPAYTWRERQKQFKPIRMASVWAEIEPGTFRI
jgi:hypothetical protein